MEKIIQVQMRTEEPSLGGKELFEQSEMDKKSVV